MKAKKLLYAHLSNETGESGEWLLKRIYEHVTHHNADSDVREGELSYSVTSCPDRPEEREWRYWQENGSLMIRVIGTQKEGTKSPAMVIISGLPETYSGGITDILSEAGVREHMITYGTAGSYAEIEKALKKEFSRRLRQMQGIMSRRDKGPILNDSSQPHHVLGNSIFRG